MIEREAIFVEQCRVNTIVALNECIPEEWVKCLEEPTFLVCSYDETGMPLERVFVRQDIFLKNYTITGCNGPFLLVDRNQ